MMNRPHDDLGVFIGTLNVLAVEAIAFCGIFALVLAYWIATP